MLENNKLEFQLDPRAGGEDAGQNGNEKKAEKKGGCC